MTDTVALPVPDTAEHSPHFDELLRDAFDCIPSRIRGELDWDARARITEGVHHGIAALAHRGWLTDEARTALGIVGEADHPAETDRP